MLFLLALATGFKTTSNTHPKQKSANKPNKNNIIYTLLVN